MANSLQAKKRARQAEKHRQHNTSLRSKLRTAIKRVLKAIEGNEKEAATQAYAELVPVIDRSAGNHIIHKNKAARHKSSLNKQIKALG